MPKNLAAVLAAAIFSSYAFVAQAVIIQTPPHRSPMQEECIKDNPKDHQGYLSCIRAKKAEKKNSDMKGTDTKGNITVPVSGAPVYDSNQPPPANKYQ